MSVPIIETHQIEDLSILGPVNDFISRTDWYALAKIPADGIHTPESLRTAPTQVVKSTINPVDGTWAFQQNLPRDENGFIPRSHTLKTTSIMRQGYGWDDASTARRAPVIYEFFQYLNRTFFNNSFTLDGVPEEVSGARHLWYDENEKDIPNWGNDVGPSGSPTDELEPTPIWTAYANAKTPATTRMALKNNRGLSNGAHRDWYGTYDTPESEADGLYTLLVNMNIDWKYSNGVELVFHETIPPGDGVGVHNRRGYGVGRPTHIFGHVPGLVILYPASAIHTTTSPGAQDSYLATKVAFRVKRKPQQ